MASLNYMTTLFFQIIDHTTQVFNTAVDLALKILKNMPDRSSQEMMDLLRDGNGDVTVTDSFAQAEEIKRRMEDQGIDPVVILNVDGQGYIYTPSDQREAAQKAVDGYYAELDQNPHITVEQMCSYTEGEVMETVLPEDEAIILMSKCEDAGIPVSVLQPEEGEAKILFAEQDRDRFEQARAEAAVDLMSSRGSAMKEQAAWRNAYTNNIRNSIINGETPDGKPLPSGTVVVDREGRMMKVNRTNIEFTDKGGTARTIAKNYKHMDRQVVMYFGQMKDPAVLSRGEAEKFERLAEKDKKDFIYRKQREDAIYSGGRPVYSKEQLDEFARQEQERAAAVDAVVEVPVQHEGNTLDHTEKMPVEQACREFGLTSDEEAAYVAVSSQPRDTFTVDDELIEKVDAYLGDTEPETASDLLADAGIQDTMNRVFHPEEQAEYVDFGGGERGMSGSDTLMRDDENFNFQMDDGL